eukprot:TRINITY_DN28151_c0_g1_i1.p1 TRINITY_DN28151_c0_g1~~TRINITY_DN28151_c0_g1_i1.p1  ORF type:complete len:144 (-),score=13.48 TRINITY_DN28151_c0_g1_i1:272-703(-)
MTMDCIIKLSFLSSIFILSSTSLNVIISFILSSIKFPNWILASILLYFSKKLEIAKYFLSRISFMSFASLSCWASFMYFLLHSSFSSCDRLTNLVSFILSSAAASLLAKLCSKKVIFPISETYEEIFWSWFGFTEFDKYSRKQ